MHWYVGAIADAVATSKTRNAIFVVYVEGKDDKSKSLTLHIDNLSVSAKLESSTFVALKLEAGSTPHMQFAEIYKNVPVPSIFFIGKAGQILDMITEIPDSNALLSRIDKVIEVHALSTVSTHSVAAQSESFIAQEQQTATVQNVATVTPSAKPENVVCENGVCYKTTENTPVPLSEGEVPQSSGKSEPEKSEPEQVTVGDEKEKTPEPAAVTSSAKDEENKENTNTEQLTTEEKMQHAKELLEKQRELKKQEEEEKEKQKEIERRKLGQEVQKLKQWQKDQELKELMEKRKKEKNEDKAARERILAQIAQDRADNAAKFGTSSPPSSPVTTEAARPTPAPVITGTQTRLQFRLPNGSSDTHTFENTVTLQEVRNYIIDNLNLPFRNFSLATSFPRREFTNEENSCTLQHLELCPTAVLLIVPAAGHVTLSHQGTGLMGFVWFLFTPIFSLYSFIKNLIYGPPPTTGRTDSSSSEKKNSGENSDSSGPTEPKRRATETTAVRRQGNIHRLSDRPDTDDDNNTWNGNSTQQM